MFWVKWSDGRHTWEKDDDLSEYSSLLARFKHQRDHRSQINKKKEEKEHAIYSEKASKILPPLELSRFPNTKGNPSHMILFNKSLENKVKNYQNSIASRLKRPISTPTPVANNYYYVPPSAYYAPVPSAPIILVNDLLSSLSVLWSNANILGKF
jgi:hypothetical protein